MIMLFGSSSLNTLKNQEEFVLNKQIEPQSKTLVFTSSLETQYNQNKNTCF